MQWAPRKLNGFGWVRGVVDTTAFAGDWPRINFAPSASTERRITHVMAGAEYALNAAATLQEYQGVARFVLWKGFVENEVDLAFFDATGIAIPDGLTIALGLLIPINKSIPLSGTLDAPLMILKPGESGGAIMGGATSLISGNIVNYIADFTVLGQEMQTGEKPRDYKLR